MTLALAQYILEISVCLLIYVWWGPRVGRSSRQGARIYWLWVPMLALMIPLLEVPQPLLAQWLQVEKVLGGKETVGLIDLSDLLRRYLAGLEFKVVDIALLVFFIGLVPNAFRLVDRLEGYFRDARLRTGKQYPLLAVFETGQWGRVSSVDSGPRFLGLDQAWMAVMQLPLWFHPLYYQVRQRLEEVHYQLLNTPPFRENLDRFMAPVVRLLFISCVLLGLFSFNWTEPLNRRLASTALVEWMAEKGDQVIWSVEKTEQYAEHLKWGVKLIPLLAASEEEKLDYPIAHLHPQLFYTLQYTLPEIQSSKKPLAIKRFSARIALAHSDQLLAFYSMSEFEAGLRKLSEVPELTIYMEIVDTEEKRWLAACTVSKNGEVYGANKAWKALSEELAGIRWHVVKAFDQTTLFYQDSCRFHWGRLQVDLRKYANPNVYTGYLELDPEELLEQITTSIQIERDGWPVTIETLTLRHYNRANNEIRNLELELVGTTAALSEKDSLFLRDSLERGDLISVFGEAEGLSLNALSFRMKDPNRLYQPEVYVSEVKQSEEVFDFQVISREGLKTKLKTDTTLESTRHIRALYQDPDRYELIHLPGFKTHNRLYHVDAASYQMEAVKKDPGKDWFYTDYLAERLDYDDRLVQLHWGKLFAMNVSEVYSPEEFDLNVEDPLKLWFDEEEVAIERLCIAILPKEGTPTYLLLNKNELNDLKALPAIQQIGEETSILIGGITCLGEQGQELFIPVNFVFHIGRSLQSRGLKLSIEEVAMTDQAEPRRHWDPKTGQLSYEQYPLTELISALTSRKMNRIEFEGLEQVPYLNIHFEAAGYNELDADEIILNAIQKEFHFTIIHEGIHRDHWRLQVSNEYKLEESLILETQAEADRVKVFAPKGYHLLTGFTMTELGDYLEDQLDLVITVWPYQNNKDRYIFGLDFSSQERIRQQLKEDYGLELVESSWLYNAMTVKFGKGPKF